MKKLVIILLTVILVFNCTDEKSNLGILFGLALLSPRKTNSCRTSTSDLISDGRAVQSISLNFLGTFQNKRFWDDLNKIGTSLISAYSPESRWVFTVNGLDGTLDIFDITNPKNPFFVRSIDFRARGYGHRPTNIAFKNGILAATAESRVRQQQGKVIFFDSWGKYLGEAITGAQPDFVTFTPNGCFALVANEGEPNDDYSWDPEGSVTVIDLTTGVNFLEAKTRQIGFGGFNHSNIDKNIRITGPGASVPKDLEPESISVTADGRLAYVSLQENNAVGILDLTTFRWLRLMPLGFKDWTQTAPYSGNGIDFRRGGTPTWGSTIAGSETYLPSFIKGQYQPDEIKIFTYNGETYFFTANEGDSRNYQSRQGDEEGDPTSEFYNEEVLITNICNPSSLAPYNNQTISSAICTGVAGFSFGSNPLRVSKIGGDTNGDGIVDEIYAFGGRSVSIFTGDGRLVWDSGSDFEEMLSGNKYSGRAFNLSVVATGREAITTTNPFYNASFERTRSDRRSDRQGPEPEGTALGKIGDKLYAFIGVERPGGLAAYDITNPAQPSFQYYLNFRADATAPDTSTIQGTQQLVNLGRSGDLGPEGVIFIHASQSPNGKDLVLVSNETSGSITLYEVVVQERR